MAYLTIPDKKIVLHEAAAIKDYLAKRGILYEKWEASIALNDDADQDSILAAYAHQLKPYMAANGYEVADVINVTPNTPNLAALRTKFLSEHTHTEDEVRFFVDGEGHFWFNLGGDNDVFSVTCQAGDLLSVPKNTSHWFDLGSKNFVKAIRIFIDMAGWVPHYTHSGIDAKYISNEQS